MTTIMILSLRRLGWITFVRLVWLFFLYVIVMDIDDVLMIGGWIRGFDELVESKMELSENEQLWKTCSWAGGGLTRKTL